MVIPFISARAELKKRLDGLFSKETFADLYDYEAPKVCDGFPVNEPPYYVAVDEIVDNANTSGGASMGHSEITFDLNVFLCAQHSDLITASNTLMAYIDVVFSALLADHTLNRTVDNTTLSISNAGTASDNSRHYIAAAAISITCTKFSQCPRAIKEVVDATNGS